MAYRTVPDSEVDSDSPITQELMFALRDNPIAIAAGDTGAARNVLKSIERVNAGNQVRSSNSLLIAAGGATAGAQFDFIQIGTVRCKIVVTSGATGSATYSISRVRNGSTTVLSSGSLTGNVTLDVSVIPGDRVTVNGTSDSTQDLDATFSFNTGGSNLWPGSQARLVNNDV